MSQQTTVITPLQPEIREDIRRQTLLVELERHIDEGQAAFARMGAALMRIRDEKLYAPEYGGFLEYCQVRWKWSQRRAYQLMQAAQVFSQLQDADIEALPQKERVVRPLTGVPEERRPEVWKRAVEKSGGSAPTASAVVEEAVQEVCPPTGNVVSIRKSPASKPKPTVASNEDILGMRLQVLEGRCQNLESLLASVLAEAGGTGRISEQLLGRIEEELGEAAA